MKRIIISIALIYFTIVCQGGSDGFNDNTNEIAGEVDTDTVITGKLVIETNSVPATGAKVHLGRYSNVTTTADNQGHFSIFVPDEAFRIRRTIPQNLRHCLS